MKNKNIFYFVIAIFFSVLIVKLAYQVIRHYDEHVQFISSEIEGANLLPEMKNILILTLRDRSKQIIIQKMQKLQRHLQVKQFLKSVYLIEEIEANIDKYNVVELTQKELKLINQIANDSNLILDHELSTYYLMDSLVNTIPQTMFSLRMLYKAKLKDSTDDIFTEYGKLADSVVSLARTFHYIYIYNESLDRKILKSYNKLLVILNGVVQKKIDVLVLRKNTAHQISESFAQIYSTNNQLLVQLLKVRKKRYQDQEEAFILFSVLFIMAVFVLFYMLSLHSKIAKQNAYLAYHDTLTTLPNRYALERDIKIVDFFCLLLIDIKRFSYLNDMYGEQIGDKVLQKFAQIIQEIAQKHYQKFSLYRVASDQFIFLSAVKDKELCQKISKDYFKFFNQNAIEIEDELKINIKIRISKVLINKKGLQDRSAAKVKAEIALGYAKQKNKDYITYDKQLRIEERLQDELNTIEMVKEAILENRVVPVFQKIQKKDIDSYEVLIRIQKKGSDELIAPVHFLDVVRYTPYYPQLTKLMIKKSFDYFKDKRCQFSLNFSFSDLQEKSTVKYLLKMVQKYGISDRLIIELLETESLQNIAVVRSFIKKVRKYGVKIAIDDFGSGYSNFIYLTQLLPDFIKIDGSIIKDIDTDLNSFIIAKHINNFAKEIGAKTIAEFVHCETVAKKLEELDIDGKQGYFIARPSPSIDFSTVEK